MGRWFGRRAQDPVFLHLHVMKTAGTSLNIAARHHFGPDAVDPPHDPEATAADVGSSGYTSLARLRDLPDERRRAVRFYAGHYPYLVRGLVRPDVTITVLREPVARTVSILRQARSRRPALAGRTLEEVYDDPWVRSTMVQDYQVKLFAMTVEDLDRMARERAEMFGLDPLEAGDRPHLMPLPMDAARLAVAKANLERVEEVGTQERFGPFLAHLRRAYGWSGDEEPTVRRTPDEPVPEELLARIREEQAWDRAFYEFAVELCERRGR